MRIIKFYNQKIEKQEDLIFKLILTSFLIGCFYLLVNRFGMCYSGFNYLPLRWVFLAPVMFILLTYSIVVKNEAPRLAFFTKAYTIYFFIWLSFAVLTNGVQYTPLRPIDHNLLKFDQVFGFNTATLLKWTTEHPFIKSFFTLVYRFLSFEILLSPVILAWLDKKKLYQFFTTMLFSFLMGTTIYYFFPTAAPVSVVHSPYFMPETYSPYIKFYELHQYLPITVNDSSLIAFPSFHVIWAVLVCFAFCTKPQFFYPLVFINFFVILATLFLGWHYLADVIAGIVIAVISIVIVSLTSGKNIFIS